MPNVRTNLRLLGAAEGSYFGNNDLRFRASFASSRSGLSFGIVQYDVKANRDAQRIFRAILSNATGNLPGQITVAEANSFFNRASTANAGTLFSKSEVATINRLLSSEYARGLITRSDAVRANSFGATVEGLMATAAQNWRNRGVRPSAALTPGTNEYLNAYAYVFATLNKNESNYDPMLNYLSGGRQSAGSKTFDLNAPPSVTEIHSFLGSLRVWDPSRGNGKYSNLHGRLDPVIGDILARPAGGGGLRYLVMPEEPYFSIFGNGTSLFGDGGGGAFSVAYYDRSEDGLVLREYGVDPNNPESYLTKDLIVNYADDGSIESIELREQDQTRQLNLEQAAVAEEQLRAFLEAAYPRLPNDTTILLLDDWITGGSRTPTIQESFLSAYIDDNGDLVLSGHSNRLLSFDPRTGRGLAAVDTGVDSFGRQMSQDWKFDLAADQATDEGTRRTRDGGLEITAKAGQPTTVRLLDSPAGVDFVDSAETITSVLGRYLIGGDAIVQTIASAGLQTLGANFGDILNTLAFDSGVATTKNMSDALEGMDAELLANLKLSGIGAVSAFLTAELVNVIGLEGFAGEALNSAAGLAVNQIVSNLAEMALGNPDITSVFQGVGNLAQLGDVAGSFLGNHLASAIGNWDEVGEQLGSSIGGTLGGIAGQTLIPVPVLGAIVGSFLGNLVGGLIGGVFTGTPKSGAIVGFDEEAGQFAVQSVWKEDGGQKRAARELGSVAAEALNGIVSFVGGELVNGDEIDAGSYGLRGKRFVYWEDDTTSDNRVKFKEAEDLIEYGVLKAIRNFDFLGGDIYAKRAFHATLTTAGTQTMTPEPPGTIESFVGELYDAQEITTVEFTLDALLGNFAVVDRLHEYLESSTTVNALIAAEPDSAFTADWLLAFSRMEDLGLLRRNTHDWDGGFTYLLKQAETSARDVQFQFQLFGDGVNGERMLHLGPWYMADTVDSHSKTIIVGGAEDDRLQGPPVGRGHVANVLRGGGGNDELTASASGDDLFGEAGDDRLVGGALDDWLIGGGGDDVLDAGGGNGNVLSGDAGNDFLSGADKAETAKDGGSDWLSGGDGDDVLAGRGGDDFLEGGAGADKIDGGRGSDTVVYRSGDGSDSVSDSGFSDTEIDRIEFGTETIPTDITVVARSAGEAMSLFVGELDSGDRIDVRGAALAEYGGIEGYSFVGEEWSRGDLTARAVFSKTAGSAIAGTSAAEELYGTIHDDSLTGGGGTDSISGGFGSDVYTFNLGDGIVSIYETGFSADLDVLVFGTGISLADIVVDHDPVLSRDITLTVGAAGDKVVLRHQALDDAKVSIEEVRFADGTSLTLRDLQAIYLAPPFTSAADTKRGFDANDSFYGGDGNDVLAGGPGADSLEGQHGADTYVYHSGDGDDRIYDIGHYGNATAGDRLVLGAGLTLDLLLFDHDTSDGNNLRVSFRDRPGSIMLDNQFQGVNSGVETIELADGTTVSRQQMIDFAVAQSTTAMGDFIVGDHGFNAIAAGAGDDRVQGWDGNDSITGGLGADYLEGGHGADTYHYAEGDGADWIYDIGNYGNYTAGDTLQFAEGIAAGSLIIQREWLDARNVRIAFATNGDSILLEDEFDGGAATIDLLAFADGTTWDKAALAAASVAQDTSAEADRIVGWHGADVIAAGDGHDRVYGWDGDDTITGGVGNDDLQGGHGADTYNYAIGDGHDTIWDQGNYGNYTPGDRLVLGTGIAAGDLILERDQADGQNLRIRISGQVGSILLNNQFDYGNGAVDSIVFADGTTWDRAAIAAEAIADAVTTEADFILGSHEANTILGLGGNDRIYAWDGDDTIAGGAGDDIMEGGAGADTYIYAAGDGDDRIYDLGNYGNTTPGDKLVFGIGIAAADIILSRDAADSRNLVVRFASMAGSILIDDQFVDANGGVESFVFADGMTWSRGAIEAAITPQVPNTVTGTEAANILSGTAGADIIKALGGNDSLAGGAGADRLEGGYGNDIYYFELGDGWDYAYDAGGTADILRFGVGIDADDVIVSRRTSDNDGSGVVFSIAGTTDSIYFASFDYDLYGNDRDVESVEFADGTVWDTYTIRAKLFSNSTVGDDVINGTTSGHDVLVGGAGHDRITSGNGGATITGGTGNDLITGGGGNDLYQYNLGDGIDTIIDHGGNDILRFGAGIKVDDITLSRRMADDERGIVISIAGTNDQIYLMSANYNRYGNNYAIERIEFADGTVLTDADLRERLMADAASAGDDFIVGSSWNDVVLGGAGDDELQTFEGNDRLTGGTGNDLLKGSSGNDTYVFNIGDGRDTIVETGGIDRIEFGTGISAADVVILPRVGDWDEHGIVFSINADGDEIYVSGANYNLYGNDQDIESIIFADGTVWTDADVRAKLFAGRTTQGDDIIHGSTFSGDLLVGGGGDDRLLGYEGDDTLNGGKGDDRLEGGSGNDLYLFERGDGYDVVNEGGGGADIMRFGSGIAEGDIKVSRKIGDNDATGVVFSIAGTRDQIYVISWDYRQYGNDRDIERVEFADGTFWTPETVTKLLSGTTITGMAVAVTMGDDDIVGSSGADMIRGMHGDDFIRGGAGSDTYVFAKGDGHDTIYDPVDAAGLDRLVLEGLNSIDVTVLTSPTDIDDIVIFIDDENIIYLDQQKAGAEAGIDEVVFANGETWTRTMLLDHAAESRATTGDDNLLGTNFAETLAGGIGNDILRGRAGADTYVYEVGDGDDVIDERESGTLSSADGAGDTIAFGPGITLADLRFARGVAGDLLLSFASMAGSILLKGQEAGRDGGVETLSFADGSTVTMESLRQSSLDALVTAGDDTITGSGRSDILSGGAGVDILIGGDGGDTYRFAAGDGIDTIVEAGVTGFDALELATGIAVSDVHLLRLATAPGDLTLALGNGTDRIVLRDQLGGGGIDSVRFADGTAWNREDLVARLLAQPATAEGDYLVGDGAANSFNGLAGDDFIDGGDGDDVLEGGLGADSIFGGRGDDTITGGDGDDLISGGTGWDQMDGGAGNDTIDFGFSRDGWTIDLAAGTALITGGALDSAETILNFEAVIGGLAADQISGNADNNWLRGAEGDDKIAGGDGDDVFVVDGAGDGFDSIDGGAGVDRIEAMSVGTVIGLTAIAGVEMITANGHDGVIIGGTEGNDSLDLSGAQLVGISSIQLGTGDDLLVSALGADTINGGEGNDVIRYVDVSSGGDAVDGGEGQDRIEAGSDNAVIRLRSFTSVETLTGAGYAGVVVAGTAAAESFDLTSIVVADIARFDLEGGADSFTGTTGADRVRGGAGDDTLAGGGGDDVFEFDSADSGHDAIDGGMGTDVIAATADGVVIGLRSLTGVEAISGDGYAGVEIRLTDEADTLDLTATVVSGIAGIWAGGGDDVIRGSAGDDVFRVSGTADGFDDLEGGGGTDRLEAGADGTILGVKRLVSVEQVSSGGYAGVTLAGTEEADALDLRTVTLDGITRISMGGGADTVEGSASADTLAGGTGNDRLSGNQGDDSYIFNLGDGKDVISEQGPGGTGGGTDVLYLGTGISVSDVVVTKTHGDQDFLLTIGNGTDTILITNGAAEMAAFWLEEIRFADGTVWTRQGLSALLSNYTPGNDTLVGTAGADIIRGGGGNDTIDGKGGDDTLIGGPDDDQLVGGDGDDTYVYNRGDGHDVIFDYRGSRANVLLFGDGIKPEDLVFSDSSDWNDIRISLVDGSGSILVDNQWWSDAGIEYVEFADGTVWNEAQIAARYVSDQQSDGDDTISGSALTNVIDAGGGNDVVKSGAAADTIVGGPGDDWLEGGSGNDTYIYNRGDGHDVVFDYRGSRGNVLLFGPGITPEDLKFSDTSDWNDIKISLSDSSGSILLDAQWWSDAGIEYIQFAEGEVWNEAQIAARYVADQQSDGDDTISGSSFANVIDAGKGNDVVVSGNAADTIIGGNGDDRLEGASGNDTYVYNRGDGNDVIFDYRGSRSNVLRFGEGITPEDLVFSDTSDWNDIKISLNDGSGSIIIDGQWWSDAGIENIQFADGMTWTEAQIAARYVSDQQSDGDDTISGSALSNVIEAGAGNDIVKSGSGADTIVGGTGDDRLEGGGGTDTYVYNRGDGHDVIFDYRGSRNNILLFGEGLTEEDVLFSRPQQDKSNLRVSFKNDDGSVTIEHQTWGDAGVELIKFSNGTVLTIAEAVGRIVNATDGADVLQGTDNDDMIWGLEGSDDIRGGLGNDSLFGQYGNDILIGGDGNDILDGGAGADVLYGDDRTYRAPVGDSLLINGSFEQSGTVEKSGWWGVANSTLPGWSKTNSQTFEQIYSNFGVAPSDGIFWLDMDAGGGSGSNMDISQSVNGLAAGQIMSLRFDHANRTSAASGSFEVYWNEELIKTISETGSYMRESIFQVVAVSGTNTVRFRGLGSQDYDGASLDNVRLFSTEDLPEGEGGDDRLTGGSGDDQIYGNGGTDVAVFSGDRSSYMIVTTNGAISIKDDDPFMDGDDGQDILIGVEAAEFKAGETLGLATPIILDLDGRGVQTVSASKSGARFDLDGDGLADDTSWIGATEAFLYLDRNGDGTLTNAGEFSFVNDVPGAKSDLEGLRAFDSSGDGILSAADARFGEFGVWVDTDGDGAVDEGETGSLTTANVRSIDLTGTPVESTSELGEVAILNRGQYTRTDGTKMEFLDAALTFFSAASNPLPLVLTSQSFGGKAKNHRVGAVNGVAVVRPTGNGGLYDPRANAVRGATIVSFKDKTYGMLTPIVLDLDGDGLELREGGKSRARFDMDGNGGRDDTGWLGRGDGFLVIDRNANGVIDDGSELSFVGENPLARSSLEGLVALDSNRDGRLDATDARFGELKVWVDANDNGVTDAGELKSLADHGIVSLDLRANVLSGETKLGLNTMLATASFTRSDGSVSSVGEAMLSFKPAAAPAIATTSAFDRPDRLAGSWAERIERRFDNFSGIDPRIVEDDFDAFAEYDGSGAARGPVEPSGFAMTNDQWSIEVLGSLDAHLGAEQRAMPVGRAVVIGALDDATSSSFRAEDQGTMPFGDSEVLGSMDGDGLSVNVASLDDARLMRMTQDMAAFGSRGFDQLERRFRESGGYLDFHAA